MFFYFSFIFYQVISGNIKILREKGLDKVKHKKPIDEHDWAKMHSSLGIDTAQGLQDLVFLNIQSYCATLVGEERRVSVP